MRSPDSNGVFKSVINSVKKTYTGEKVFSEIQVGVQFEGSQIDKLIFPRLEIITHKFGFKTSLIREKSLIFPFDSPRKPSISKMSVNIEDILHNSAKDKDGVTHLLIKSANNLDNSLMIQQILYKWGTAKLSQEFESVFVIDFAFFNSFVGERNEKLIKLAKFIKHSSDLLESDVSILKVLEKIPSKTLIVIKNYDQLSLTEYQLARDILTEASRFNVLLTSSNERLPFPIASTINPLSNIFHFDVELNNIGYSSSDIVKYLMRVFPNQKDFSNIMDLMNENHQSLFKICHNPTVLQMISYIWSKSKEMTLTNLYYDFFNMVKSLGNEAYEKYIFSKPVLANFIQAMYIKENLVGRSSEAIKSSLDYISSIGSSEDNIKILKYISGLIAMHENEEEKKYAMGKFFEAFISSDKEILKIGGDIKITSLMHIIYKVFQNSKSYDLVPEGLMEYIDSIILKDIKKWEQVLIVSKYSSPVIVTKLLEMINSDNQQEFLIAAKILPKLVLDENQRQILVHKFQQTINSLDFKIVEKSIEALGHFKEIPGVKNILISILDNSSVNVKIVAIKVLSGFLDSDVRYKLLEQLASKDKWVVISVLEELEVIYYLSTHLEKEAIVKKLFLKLNEKEGEQELIFEKTLSLLNIFRYDVNKVATIFIDKFKNSSNYGELNTVIDTLKNIFNKITEPTTKDQIVDLIIEKRIYLKKTTLIPFINTDKHYDTRAKIKEALGEVFEFSSDKERIYLVLKSAFEGKGVGVLTSVAATKALIKIFSYNREEIFSLLLENLTKARIVEVKTSIICGVEQFLDQLSPKQLKQVGDVITSTILNSDDDGPILSSIVRLLTKINILEASVNVKDISKKLMDIINNTKDKDLLIHSIEALGHIFEHIPAENITPNTNIRSKILELLLFRIDHPKIMGETIIIAKVLLDIYNLLPTTKQKQVFETLDKAYKESSFGELKFVLKDILSILEKSRTSEIFGMKFSEDDERDSIKLIISKEHPERIIESIEVLVNKYSNLNSIITLEDQIQLNGLFEIILSSILETDNNIVSQRMVSILLKAEYSNQQVLEVLSNYDASDGQKYYNKIASIFSSNVELIYEANKLVVIVDSVSVIKAFPTIEELISKIDLFTQYVQENNIDVKITRKYISFNDEIYLSATEVGDFQLYLQYAKIIFNNLNQGSNKLVNITNSDASGIFGAFDQRFIEDDQIKLSIVYQHTSDSKKPNNVFLIIEYKTIFDDVMSQKLFINNGYIKTTFQSDINLGYKIDLFGGNSEFLHYYVNSFFISQDELKSLVTLSKGWISKEDLANNTLMLLSENRPYLIKYKWSDGVAISHNNLIDYKDIESRVSYLEAKVNELEHDLRGELEKLQINQQESKKLIDNIMAHIRYSENIELPSNLNSYQQALFLELVHGLNALHMAAMVVQTSMVANNQKGLLSAIGGILGEASSSLPFFGVVVQLFGAILESVDEKIQETISKNIASLALDSVDMAKLAKKIAFTLIDKDFKISEVHKIQSSISTKLKELVINVDLNFVKKAIDMIDGLRGVETDESKAAEDAADIINVITGLLITGECKTTINWNDNFEILKNFFLDNNIIVEHTLASLVRSTSDTSTQIALVRSTSDSSTKIALVRSTSDSSTQSGELLLDIESQFFPLLPLDRIDENLIDEDLGADKSMGDNENKPENFNINSFTPLILNGLEVIPSAKYLCTVYVPGCNYIKNLDLFQAIAPYEHVIESTISVFANLEQMYYHPENYMYNLLSMGAFVFKPQIYGLRDQILSYIDDYSDNQYIKLSSYILVDTLRSTVLAFPFYGLNSQTFIYAANQGMSSGTINYYNSQPHKDSASSDVFAKIMTTAALYPCYKFIQSMPTLELQIFAMQMCIPSLASTYYYSRYYADVTGDIINNIAGDVKEVFLEQN